MSRTFLTVAVLGFLASAHRAPAQTITAPEPTPIEVGGSASGELRTGDMIAADGSYQDTYVLAARAGDRLEIFLSADFDAFLILGRTVDGEFKGLATDDDGGGGTDARLLFAVPETGDYHILANSLKEGETGSYALAVTGLPPATSAAPTSVAHGELRQGRLEATDALMGDGSYYDEFVFSGRQGDAVGIDMVSPDFDTFLGLGIGHGEAWETIVSDDDGGTGTDSRIVVILPETGDYVIRANSLSGGITGAYSIRLGDAPGPGGGATKPLIVAGETRVGRLESGDEMLADGSYYDAYTYEGREGELVTITLRSEEFDAYLTLGEVVEGGYEEVGSARDGAGGTDAEISLSLSRTGSYLIRANSRFPGSTGSYALQVTSR